MKLPSPAQVIGLIAITAIACALIMAVAGCRSAKIDKSSNTVTIDSSATEKYQQLIHQYEAYKMESERQIGELRQSRVEFEQTPCPPVNIPESCNADSLARVVRILEARDREKNNTIEVTASGSIKAKGQIKSLNVDLQKTLNEKEQLSRQNDSIAEINKELSARLNKKTVVEEKHVERKQGGFLSWWWLFPAGVVAGAAGLAYWQRKKLFT